MIHRYATTVCILWVQKGNWAEAVTLGAQRWATVAQKCLGPTQHRADMGSAAEHLGLCAELRDLQDPRQVAGQAARELVQGWWHWGLRRP